MEDQKYQKRNFVDSNDSLEQSLTDQSKELKSLGKQNRVIKQSLEKFKEYITNPLNLDIDYDLLETQIGDEFEVVKNTGQNEMNFRTQNYQMQTQQKQKNVYKSEEKLFLTNWKEEGITKSLNVNLMEDQQENRYETQANFEQNTSSSSLIQKEDENEINQSSSKKQVEYYTIWKSTSPPKQLKFQLPQEINQQLQNQNFNQQSPQEGQNDQQQEQFDKESQSVNKSQEISKNIKRPQHRRTSSLMTHSLQRVINNQNLNFNESKELDIVEINALQKQKSEVLLHVPDLNLQESETTKVKSKRNQKKLEIQTDKNYSQQKKDINIINAKLMDIFEKNRIQLQKQDKDSVNPEQKAKFLKKLNKESPPKMYQKRMQQFELSESLQKVTFYHQKKEYKDKLQNAVDKYFQYIENAVIYSVEKDSNQINQKIQSSAEKNSKQRLDKLKESYQQKCQNLNKISQTFSSHTLTQLYQNNSINQ